MKKTAILYGSTTGNTKSIAKLINQCLDNQAEVKDVDDLTASDIESYECLILGTSTWGLGDLQDDWDSFITELDNADLEGKTIALFGLGDAASYPDTFVDGMGTIYKAIVDKGCQIVGAVSADGYSFDASSAVINNSLVGLAIDEDNESNKTEERVRKWVDLILAGLN
ncbi:flavodoxin [Carboxylicivirga caseinilyticus]|uniref:flavodoxin n=1 Tax=Carboxylicivirga caseinilyticus TaxID=3417572 RepID=UPI003D34D18B|nr:flavodoxin [Marinilabiliaceae bacterium A049]